MDNAPVHRRPRIGITPDLTADRLQVGRGYVHMIDQAGGLPIILPCLPALAGDLLQECDGLVLTGGDDPDMTQWGVPQHPQARAIDPQRQAFELALLRELDRNVDLPALAVCLGMQLLGLHCGGQLIQHLPDTLSTAGDHWDRRTHAVDGELGRGEVHSHHRQALSSAGSLRVIAHASDGVIEAVECVGRPAMLLGVQWHPERTDDLKLGRGLFERLVDAARRRVHGAP